MRASGWASIACDQSSRPVAASSAYTFAPVSPKYTAYEFVPSIRPNARAVRTPLFAVNVQWMQPLFASSEYTVPFWLPTNSRPLATVGCDHADVASGKPNAHLSESLGTWSAVSPACALS